MTPDQRRWFVLGLVTAVLLDVLLGLLR